MDKVQTQGITSALIAVSILLLSVIYGLILRPVWFELPALSLEIVFFIASIGAISQVMILGHKWQSIQQSILSKLSRAFPTILLLFTIGILIGSWMLSGTIPMLIDIGLKTVDTKHIYIGGFFVPIVFSLCTGSSWSTIATLGLAIITVGHVVGADLGILAGAIVGGAYFGDKLSPLSDTTNIAAVAVGVDVISHIKSMLFTTLPAATIAGLLYFLLGVSRFVEIDESNIETLEQIRSSLSALFTFNFWLLLPPVIIIFGSIKRYPAVPTLILSSLSAYLLSITFQEVSIENVFSTFQSGFNVDMIKVPQAEESYILKQLLNRGGLYALMEPIVITIMVFVYLGTIDRISAVPRIVSFFLSQVKKPSSLIISTLIASGITNSLTSSQYANSFIVGEAFSEKYKEMNIPAPILSRSLEDTGTMLESLIPWSTTAVFVYTSLGVSVYEYWDWQFLSLINIFLAFLYAKFAITYQRKQVS